MRLLGSNTETRKDRLVAGLNEMAARTQDLLREAGAEVGEKLGETRTTLAEAGTAVSRRAQHAAGATDAYVRENPWTMVGVAVAVGALLAVLLSRR